MEHFAIHKLSKTHTSLLLKDSNSLCCGNPNSAVYFYHSDHLGSASWITNDSGTPIQHLQYMPYGEPFVNERTSSYEERFTFTGKERDSETGFSYFGARYYDSDILTGWLSVDPMADKYPGLSPYAYCGWNPVKLVDPDGKQISTHTDHEGNVVAVFNDGDNGVYQHQRNADGSNVTEYQISKRYEKKGSSAGGKYMGESLHSLSFADQNLYNKTGQIKAQSGMVIDYGSNELTTLANSIMNEEPSIYGYQKNAKDGGIWDIKKHIKKGSMLYGKYASPRDAGNFVAGMFAASKGRLLETIIQMGYGAYNIAGNDKLKAALMIFGFIGTCAGSPSDGLRIYENIMNGEDILSQRSIDLGKNYYRNKK